MRRLWGFTTIAIVWMVGVANGDPRFETNWIAEAKRDARETESRFGGDSDPVPAEEVAAVAARLKFDRGRAKLTVASRTALDPLVDTLRAHATLRLRVVGFATNAGARVDVARRRARVVKWYLIDGGIASDRIDTSVSASKEAGKAIELQLGTLAVPVDQRLDRATASDLDRAARDASELASILTASAFGPRNRQVGANLDQLIEDARKQRVTIPADGPRFRDDRTSSVGIKRSPGLATLQPMLSVSEPKRGEIDFGRTSGAPHAVAATPATPEMVDIVNVRYMRGLSRCYRASLVGDLSRSRRVGMSFGIDNAGSVVDLAVDGVDQDLDGCFRDQMTAWRFPVPLSRRDAPTGARFSITLVLQAN